MDGCGTATDFYQEKGGNVAGKMSLIRMGKTEECCRENVSHKNGKRRECCREIVSHKNGKRRECCMGDVSHKNGKNRGML